MGCETFTVTFEPGDGNGSGSGSGDTGSSLREPLVLGAGAAALGGILYLVNKSAERKVGKKGSRSRERMRGGS